MPRPVEHRFAVPLYRKVLLVSVSDDPEAQRRRHDKTFGTYTAGPADGIAESDGYCFAVFLDRSQLSFALIAHEAFHVAHRVMEQLGTPITPQNHEPFAYLCGWVADRIASVAGVEIRPTAGKH